MGAVSVRWQRKGPVSRKDLLEVGRAVISVLEENSEMMGQSPLCQLTCFLDLTDSKHSLSPSFTQPCEVEMAGVIPPLSVGKLRLSRVSDGHMIKILVFCLQIP